MDETLDRRAIRWLQKHHVVMMQAALGLVFVWFGLLKLIGLSPVEDLVAATVPLVDGAWAVPFLGVWEIAIGILLLWGRFVRIMLALFVVQMLGTFSILVVHPALAFQGYNPLLLTVEGEFVVKNLVLLAAGLSVGAHLLAQQKAVADDDLPPGDTP